MRNDVIPPRHWVLTEPYRLGRDAFLKKYGFRKSKQYLLLYKEKNYDSKPIYGVAHGFATDEFLTAKDFSGDFDHAAGYLVDLGFNVPGPSPNWNQTGRFSYEIAASFRFNQ